MQFQISSYNTQQQSTSPISPAAGVGGNSVNTTSMMMRQQQLTGGGGGAGGFKRREAYTVDPIKYRSVTEKRLAEQLLEKEGQWDEQSKTFLTKEKQLQQRTHLFQQLHQTLRYSPDRTYDDEGCSTNAHYPNCPQDLLKKRKKGGGGGGGNTAAGSTTTTKVSQHKDLSWDDPNMTNIEERQKQAELNRLEREKRNAASTHHQHQKATTAAGSPSSASQSGHNLSALRGTSSSDQQTPNTTGTQQQQQHPPQSSTIFFDPKEREEFVSKMERELVEVAESVVRSSAPSPAMTNISLYSISAGGVGSHGGPSSHLGGPHSGMMMMGGSRLSGGGGHGGVYSALSHRSRATPSSLNISGVTAAAVTPQKQSPNKSTSSSQQQEEVRRSMSTRGRQQQQEEERMTLTNEEQQQQAAQLPKLRIGDPAYSSTMSQLRKTKKEAQEYQKELSTVRSILSIDANVDLRRTITKMFANPKNAEKISHEEHLRREKMFEDERKRAHKHQINLLKSEREMMEREMAHMKM